MATINALVNISKKMAGSVSRQQIDASVDNQVDVNAQVIVNTRINSDINNIVTITGTAKDSD